METSLQIFISTVLNVLWNTCFKVLMKSVEYFKTVDGYKKRQFYLFIFFFGEPESKILCCTNVCTECIPPYSCTRTILLMLLPWSLSVQFSLHHLYLFPPLSQPVSIFGGNNLICNCLPTFQCSCFAQCVRPWHCLLCCCVLVQQCKYAIQSSL